MLRPCRVNSAVIWGPEAAGADTRLADAMNDPLAASQTLTELNSDLALICSARYLKPSVTRWPTCLALEDVSAGRNIRTATRGDNTHRDASFTGHENAFPAHRQRRHAQREPFCINEEQRRQITVVMRTTVC
ncbi:uncharacterized [Tachysurus ichikawai]